MGNINQTLEITKYMNSFTHLIRQMIYDVFYSFVNHDTGFLNVSVCVFAETSLSLSVLVEQCIYMYIGTFSSRKIKPDF